MVSLTINNKKIQVEKGTTLLDAAKENNILIPSFCNRPDVHPVGSCRICSVEVEGEKNLQASCMIQAKEGMVVHTNTEKVKKARKLLFELMLSDHPRDCLSCSRNLSCEFQKLGELMRITHSRFDGSMPAARLDESSPAIVRDTAKCVLCRRCVTACNEVQGVGVLNVQERGPKSYIGPTAGQTLNSVNCIACGQCVNACPTGALHEKDSTAAVWDALYDKGKTVVVQADSAIPAALGEEFGYEPGSLVKGKMATALWDMGFDYVVDTSFGADLAIVEQSHELLRRMKSPVSGKAGNLPLITSCSPGWVKQMEHAYPDRLEYLSRLKSPHMMLGALIKSYFAGVLDIHPKEMFIVTVTSCTAKKFEITRNEVKNKNLYNVDAVLTTRELARMIKEAGMDFRNLEEGDFYKPLGVSSAAGNSMGVPGGTAEAVLRTVYKIATGRDLSPENLQVKEVECLPGAKHMEVRLDDPMEDYGHLKGTVLAAAAASGVKRGKGLMEQVCAGSSPYQFIEVLGCPDGCINGGGQPRFTGSRILAKRMEALHRANESNPLKNSYENRLVEKLYEEFLSEPQGKKSQDLLCTAYTKRGVYNELT